MRLLGESSFLLITILDFHDDNSHRLYLGKALVNLPFLENAPRPKNSPRASQSQQFSRGRFLDPQGRGRCFGTSSRLKVFCYLVGIFLMTWKQNTMNTMTTNNFILWIMVDTKKIPTDLYSDYFKLSIDTMTF